MGEEAIIPLGTFTLEGSENKTLRNTFNKIGRQGYKVELVEPPLSDELLDELHSISDEWLTLMGAAEMRFSLGWFDPDYIRSSRVMLVRDAQDNLWAFTNLLSEYQKNELSLDLMRHRAQIENGVMDFLFLSLFQWAKAQGYDSFNLGLSSLAGVGEKKDDPATERLLHWVYDNVQRVYNFKGLHRFKDKFHPLWEPRFINFIGQANMPAAWVAVVQANAGKRAFSFPLKTSNPKKSNP